MADEKGKLQHVDGPHTWSRERGYEPVELVEPAETEAGPASEPKGFRSGPGQAGDAPSVQGADQPPDDVNSEDYQKAIKAVVLKGFSEAEAKTIVARHGVKGILDLE